MTDIAEESHYEDLNNEETDLSLRDYQDLLQDNNPIGITDHLEIIP